jgi:hypothetical protein
MLRIIQELPPKAHVRGEIMTNDALRWGGISLLSAAFRGDLRGKQRCTAPPAPAWYFCTKARG